MGIRCAAIDEPRGKGWRRFLEIYQDAFKSPFTDSEHLVADKIRSRRYLCILARDGAAGPVVGGTLVSYMRPVACGYIAFTCVDQKRRSQGIGKSLLAASTDMLDRKAYEDRLNLRGVFAEVRHGRHPEDRARVRFWRREGFQALAVGWAAPVRLMLRSGLQWTPMDLVPVYHAIFSAGYRHIEDYDDTLRSALRELLRLPLEKPVGRS